MGSHCFGAPKFLIAFKFFVNNILSVNSYTPVCAVRYLKRVIEAWQRIFILDPDMPQTSSAPFSDTFVGRFASLNTGDGFRGTYFIDGRT
jgi:hypothetical protein